MRGAKRNARNFRLKKNFFVSRSIKISSSSALMKITTSIMTSPISPTPKTHFNSYLYNFIYFFVCLAGKLLQLQNIRFIKKRPHETRRRRGSREICMPHLKNNIEGILISNFLSEWLLIYNIRVVWVRWDWGESGG